MRAQVKLTRKFQIETECINLMADAGATFRVTAAFSGRMRDAGQYLPDVRFVLASGKVIRSDMREQLGLWDVRGTTLSGARLTVTVLVDSVEGYVEPVDIR